MTSLRVVATTLALNVALCAAHLVVGWLSGSQIVLAQAADSLFDIAVGVVLLVSVKVAAQPSDANHPFGHQRAEPIGALVTAVLAAVLAVEVARSAVAALLADAAPRVDTAVIGVLAAKFASKLVLLVVLMRRRAAASQAVDATRIDTWNDVLTTGSSLLGIVLVTTGWPRADALLALPIAASIGRNGWGLARQSLRFLMGEAPPAEVSDELLARAAAIPGVVSVPRLRAHYVGSTLHVQVNLLIAAGSSAAQSHDIEIDVLRALESDPRVGEAFVHIDTGEGKDGT
ncbi:MAG TPA: cation diffusion facilitator family transporter [Planctomycetota bacterium]|nr:cation diffusion facilitator family transporter [Planctomycetota bacterium]